MRKDFRSRLAFVLAAIGGGLCLYAALQWRALPHYSERELAASTELNLSLDLARLGTEQPPAERIETMRRAVRAEVDADIGREREHVEAWFGAGLAFLALALAQVLARHWLNGDRK